MSETGRLHTDDLTTPKPPPEATQRETAEGSSAESQQAWTHLLGDTEGFTSRWSAIPFHQLLSRPGS